MVDTLITATELAAQLHTPGWVIVDCRHDLAAPRAGRAAYDAGHVEGARFADLDRDLSDKRPGPDGKFRGRHPLPQPEAFVATLRRWGISNDTQVVAYDAHGGMFAARLWWMMRWIGHRPVAVLDGGLQAWTDAGLPLSTAAAELPAAGDIALRPSLCTTVTVDQVLANIGERSHTLIDARAPDRYRGQNETLDPVAGHIPGAINRFFKDNLLANGGFKPAAQLRAEFEALRANPDKTIVQCGSGVTACHHLLAMEFAGLPGAALYPGSWSEWCADPARPIARDE